MQSLSFLRLTEVQGLGCWGLGCIGVQGGGRIPDQRLEVRAKRAVLMALPQIKQSEPTFIYLTPNP